MCKPRIHGGFLFPTPDWPSDRCLSKQGMNGSGAPVHCRLSGWVDHGCPGRSSLFSPADRHDDSSGCPYGLEASPEKVDDIVLSRLRCCREEVADDVTSQPRCGIAVVWRHRNPLCEDGLWSSDEAKERMAGEHWTSAEGVHSGCPGGPRGTARRGRSNRSFGR